jgi:hypothetical protein
LTSLLKTSIPKANSSCTRPLVVRATRKLSATYLRDGDDKSNKLSREINLVTNTRTLYMP